MENAEHAPLASQADETSVRERLLEAATRLFAERGYAATSVSEIVAAAGVTKPILYYYFKNKEGIYLEILRDAFAPFENLLNEAAEWQGTALGRVRRLAGRLYDLFVAKIQAARVIHGIYYGPAQGAPDYDIDAHRHHHFTTLRHIMEQGISAGELKPNDPGDMALAAISLIWIALDLELSRPDLHQLGREGVDRLLVMFFEGIAAPRA